MTGLISKRPRVCVCVCLRVCCVSPLPLRPPFRKLFPEARRAELTQEAMRSADVDPTLRPTQLTIAQVGALADAYARLCAREPDLRGYEFREELRLKHLSGRRSTLLNSVQVSLPPPPPSIRDGKATKELLLIACFGAGRQQIALSGDISTWRTHAFLKSSLPAPREPSAPRRDAAIKRSTGRASGTSWTGSKSLSRVAPVFVGSNEKRFFLIYFLFFYINQQ